MKVLFTLLIALLPAFAQAQTNWPDCNTMVVNNVALANDSLQVTLYNNCTNCNAGMDGPVYCEMLVTRTVAPFDTLGRSNCYCFITPDNQTALTYKIAAETGSLPSFNQMQVVLFCGSGTCEVIPFSANVGIDDEIANRIKVYPNPATNYIVVQSAVKGTVLTLTDVAGHVVLNQTLLNYTEEIDISALAKGFYMAQLSQCYNMFKAIKIVKQ